MRVLLLLAILAIGVGVSRADDEAPCEISVETEYGTICGVKKMDGNGGYFASFTGIPYAKAPVGKLRFAEPQKRDPFDGVFNATNVGFTCPQPVTLLIKPLKNLVMVEDCLRINIYVPLESLPSSESDNDSPLPVYAYMHGGSFFGGAGHPGLYGPEYLVTKGVVVVTFNFRLNAVGFLSLDSKYIPGNAGLRDAIFALNWIQDNIGIFGGDKKEVTLAGVSSGAAMAHLIAVSPAVKGKGLFKRVQASSGNAIANFFSPAPVAAKLISSLFLEKMNISALQFPDAIHKQLYEAPIEKITDVVEQLQTIGLNFSPVVESHHDGITPILPQGPENLLKDGYGKEYNTLFSFASNECSPAKDILKSADIEDKLQKLPFLTVPQNLLYYSNPLKVPILINKISHEYYNDTSPTLEHFLDFCTDSNYKYPAMRGVEKRLGTAPKPTYMYEFGFSTKENLLKNFLNESWQGAGHSEDVLYYFRPNDAMEPIKPTELDGFDVESRMRQFMTTIISNFAKDGYPAPQEVWPQTDYQYSHVVIEKPDEYNFQPASDYLKEKKEFYDNLYDIGWSLF